MAKELVVYFSVYGTAKIVAEEIAKQTGADIAEIEPVVPYDSNRDHYNALARLAKKDMTATGITTTRWQDSQRKNMTRISGLRSRTRSTSKAMTGSISVTPCGGTPSR